MRCATIKNINEIFLEIKFQIFQYNPVLIFFAVRLRNTEPEKHDDA